MKNLREIMAGFIPQKKYYFLLCCFIVLFSQVKRTGAIINNLGYYTYEYGFINPWIRIYHNSAKGIQSLVYALTKSNLGVELFPQYIFIDVALLYMIIAVIKFIHDRFLKQSFC